MGRIPRAGRPHMPKGYQVPEDEDGLLPWEHARERLETAHIYWIGTTRPDGRPHVGPIWGIWLDNRLYFDGSPETRRSRNIAQNPATTAHLDSGGAGKDVVIVEGNTHEIVGPDRSLADRLSAAYSTKYAADGYAPEPDTWDRGGLYKLTPRVVLAWTTFFADATRWQFDA